jgi:hypothetical protein
MGVIVSLTVVIIIAILAVTYYPSNKHPYQASILEDKYFEQSVYDQQQRDVLRAEERGGYDPLERFT